MAALKPGGYLSPLSTPLLLKYHITNVLMDIFPDASLLRIPPVYLLNIATLRGSTDDLLFLEYFGYLIWKDPVNTCHRGIYVLRDFWRHHGDPATKDLWARITTLPDLVNAINGLCRAIEHLLPP